METSNLDRHRGNDRKNFTFAKLYQANRKTMRGG